MKEKWSKMKKIPLFRLEVCRIYLSLCCSYYTNICLLFITVMKKLLLQGWVFLALSCVLASCANDELAAVAAEEKKEVTLTTHLGLNSRSALQSENLELFYTVYDAETGAVSAKNTNGVPVKAVGENASVTITLALDKGKTYDLAFWAQPKGLDCYDLSDLKAIRMDYERCKGNDAYRDAYFGNLYGLYASTQSDVTVYLKSPFSRLEVLTTVEDVEAAATIGFPVDNMLSSIQVTGVAATFNALYGKAEGEAVVAKLLPGAVPMAERTIDGKEYRVLTSDYLLAFRQQPIEVEVSLAHTDIEKQGLVFTAGRAWLNRGEVNSLYGRFLTYPIEFDATVNGWQENDGDIEI